MTDFRDCFPTDAHGSSPANLEVLKLTEQPRIIAVFTTECTSVETHFIDTNDFRGYLQCNAKSEGRCLLCDIGQKSEPRLVLPVYDVESDSVNAMLVSNAMSPHSLGPQLRREIERGDLDKRFLVLSRHYAKFEVRSASIPNGAETGETVIAEFLQQVKDGRASLGEVIPRLANRELAEIAEIERKATALGLLQEEFTPASQVSLTAADE